MPQSVAEHTGAWTNPWDSQPALSPALSANGDDDPTCSIPKEAPGGGAGPHLKRKGTARKHGPGYLFQDIVR